MKPGHTLRQAEPADADAISEIVQRAYEMYLPRMDKPPGPMLDDYAARIREDAAFVLENGGAAVGVIVLIAKEDHLLLDNVAIDPEFQGRGLGRLLIEFAEAEASRRGYAEIRLYTNATMHENVALYARLGYEETGRGEQAGYQRVFMSKKIPGRL